MISPMPDCALGYAELGWAVHPCDPGSKAPLLQHGHLEASADPGIVARWWRTWPAALIGVAIPANGLVIDLDPRNGCDVDSFLEEFDLPHPLQLVSLSGRHDGGMHLYFTRPKMLPGWRIRGKVTGRPGVDVKDTGYVIAPPSPHPATGEPYIWAGPAPYGEERSQWAAVPQPLVDLITYQEHREQPHRVRRLTDPVRRDEGTRFARRMDALLNDITEGNRNRGLYDALQICHRDNFPGNWQGALTAAASAAGLPDLEIDRVVRSALKGN